MTKSSQCSSKSSSPETVNESPNLSPTDPISNLDARNCPEELGSSDLGTQEGLIQWRIEKKRELQVQIEKERIEKETLKKMALAEIDEYLTQWRNECKAKQAENLLQIIFKLIN